VKNKTDPAFVTLKSQEDSACEPFGIDGDQQKPSMDQLLVGYVEQLKAKRQKLRDKRKPKRQQ